MQQESIQEVKTDLPDSDLTQQLVGTIESPTEPEEPAVQSNEPTDPSEQKESVIAEEVRQEPKP